MRSAGTGRSGVGGAGELRSVAGPDGGAQRGADAAVLGREAARPGACLLTTSTRAARETAASGVTA